MTHQRHTETDEHAQDSTVELVGGMMGDAKELALAHVDGLRLELKKELQDLKVSTKYAAGAGALLVVATLLAGFAIAEALELYTSLPSWAAYAIVSAVTFGLGAAVLYARSRKPQDIDLIPESGIARVERDAKWMANRTQDAVP